MKPIPYEKVYRFITYSNRFFHVLCKETFKNFTFCWQLYRRRTK